MTGTRLHRPNCGLVRSPGHVTVQNRVVKYLVPGDSLFEEAGNQVLWRCVGETFEGSSGRCYFSWNNIMKDELAGKERHGEIYLPAMAKNLSENCLVGTINAKDLAHFLQEVGNQKRNMHAEGSSVPTGEVFTNTLLMFVSTSISRENCWGYWLEHRIDCRLLRQQESIWFQISNASR